MPRSKVSLDGIIEEMCRYYSVEEKDWGASGGGRRLSEARGMAAWLIMELGICTLRELGERTGRDVTTLSSAVKRLQMRAREDSNLARKMKTLLGTIS